LQRGAALAARVGTGYGDPRGLAPLREALAARAESQLGRSVDPAEVVVTSGAKQALAECLRCTVDAGDEVLVLAPYWPTYLQQIELAGGTPVVVPADGAGRPDLARALRAATSRTRAIVVNDPHNPTSTKLSDADWSELGAFCERTGVWLIVDAVYAGLVHGSAGSWCGGRIVGALERLVVVDSFSKSFGLSGLRVGHAVAPRLLADAVARMVTSTTTCPSILSQCVALAALEEEHSLPHRLRARYGQRLADAHRFLVERLGADCPAPAAGFYLFPRFRARRPGAPGGGPALDGDALATRLRREAG
ncbi:MAG: pyridoxal phosphate-dependent aminotransferase, partial [Planctomycetota bacterium]